MSEHIDAAAELAALRVWHGRFTSALHRLRQVPDAQLMGAVEAMHAELCVTETQRLANEALKALYAEIGHSERRRVEADVAAITAVLPELLSVLEAIGGTTELADRVHHLARRLRDHYQGKPYGAGLLDALAFYADARIYTHNPVAAVEYGFAAELAAITQDAGARARLALLPPLPEVDAAQRHWLVSAIWQHTEPGNKGYSRMIARLMDRMTTAQLEQFAAELGESL
jgi:hypothetical protein